MWRFAVPGLLLAGVLLSAEEPEKFHLAAPEGWGGETIALPPGFAKDMALKGDEHIRFAPGMMKPASDTFFSYAFVFDLDAKPALTQDVLKAEFLKYYRGLCTTVLNGKVPDVDPSKFTLELKPVKPATKADEAADAPRRYQGTLTWVEPFATRKNQTLNLEIQTWTSNDRNFLFACVSPQAIDRPIWKQLRTIRDDYLKK